MSRLVSVMTLCLAISACARGAGVTENTKTSAAGTAAASRISDLQVAPAIRRLYSANAWVNEEVRPSPDGRYVSMTDWNTGNLALRDLTTDSTVSLTHKGSWNDSNDFAESSLISPDGKWIAYGWYLDSTTRFDLKVMSLAGADSGKVRVMNLGSRVAVAMAQEWTPDSKNILSVLQLDDKTTHIAIVPVSGAKSKRLKSFDWRSPTDLSISPDGRWLAYDFPPKENSNERDVFLLALDGSSESVISSEKGDDFVVGWTHDGSRLLYGSERGGTPSIWAVSALNGKASSAPVLVRSDMWRMVPLGATKAGRLVYGVNTGTRDVFTAAINPKTGEVASKPAAINGPANINPFILSWSPDGEHIAQVVLRGRGFSGPYGPSDIIVRSIERGEVRRISPDMSRIQNVIWAPDGASLIVLGADTKGRNGLFTVDLQTAKMRTIIEFAVPAIGQGLTLAPDSKTAYFVNLDGAFHTSQITRLDLGTGAKRVLYTREGQQFTGMAVSPDGRQLAIGMRSGANPPPIIALLPVTGGTPREIYRFSETESMTQRSLGWSKDGQELIFGASHSSSSGPSVEVRAVSVSDGRLRSLRVPRGNFATIRVSPDGRRIAYIVDDMAFELWTMDQPIFDSKQTVPERR